VGGTLGSGARFLLPRQERVQQVPTKILLQVMLLRGQALCTIRGTEGVVHTGVLGGYKEEKKI